MQFSRENSSSHLDARPRADRPRPNPSPPPVTSSIGNVTQTGKYHTSLFLRAAAFVQTVFRYCLGEERVNPAMGGGPMLPGCGIPWPPSGGVLPLELPCEPGPAGPQGEANLAAEPCVGGGGATDSGGGWKGAPWGCPAGGNEEWDAGGEDADWLAPG